MSATDGNSGAIGVGDLVMLIHACCHQSAKYLGIPTIVQAIYSNEEADCTCGLIHKGTLVGVDLPHKNAAPPSWFKRIPPLDELDDVKWNEEITA